ncbi:MAG: hypothetical protein JNM31_01350 [Flavobacteriales bacterium]|nr:hypothetical protein [Flavobacteriales bacterium]
MNFRRTFLFLSLIGALLATVSAQGKKGPAKPVMPVDGRVKVDNGRTKPTDITVKVFKDNTELTSFAIQKGRFQVELDMGTQYALLISKPGYKSKLILVDTNVPVEVGRYPAFPCQVDLEPENALTGGDPFFEDFPNAIIRYSTEFGGHAPSPVYATHIRARQGSLVQARP